MVLSMSDVGRVPISSLATGFLMDWWGGCSGCEVGGAPLSELGVVVEVRLDGKRFECRGAFVRIQLLDFGRLTFGRRTNDWQVELICVFLL